MKGRKRRRREGVEKEKIKRRVGLGCRRRRREEVEGGGVKS